MAQVHGVAGEWARVRGMVTSMWPLFVACAGVGFSIALILLPYKWALPLAVFLFLVALGFVAWSLNRGMKRVARFYVGARGEERVANILRGLSEDYDVFNDFVACGKHVDHVVVGPAGVFSIETKYWRGHVTLEEGHILLDGRLPDRSPLVQARHEADLVKEQLVKAGVTVDVTPLLCFASNTFSAKGAETPQGVIILNSCDLAESFKTEVVVLPAAERRRLVTLMENAIQ